jgi:hypothetical protein
MSIQLLKENYLLRKKVTGLEIQLNRAQLNQFTSEEREYVINLLKSNNLCLVQKLGLSPEADSAVGNIMARNTVLIEHLTTKEV